MTIERLIAAGIAYGGIAFLVFRFLAWKWRRAESGIRPSRPALLWPLTALGLMLYYLGVSLYTVIIVLRARRLPEAARV